MTQAIILVAIALFLIWLLLIRAGSGDFPTSKTPQRNTPYVLLDLELPSRSLAARMFTPEDWEFVCREAPLLQYAFLKERRAVALFWLDETRRSMAQLFRFHRTVIRHAPKIQIALEIKIFADYLSFLFMVTAASCLMRVLGPFRVSGVTGAVFGAAERVSYALESTLNAIEPPLLARLKEDWLRQYRSAG